MDIARLLLKKLHDNNKKKTYFLNIFKTYFFAAIVTTVVEKLLQLIKWLQVLHLQLHRQQQYFSKALTLF